ncbi:MAG: hypothetical protein KAS12_01385 [Candidatus Aenigmarchaeota archaeon]|nr:hypothetical protein [Candidatus Aenigmarchaeota archaeon]
MKFVVNDFIGPHYSQKYKLSFLQQGQKRCINKIDIIKMEILLKKEIANFAAEQNRG